MKPISEKKRKNFVKWVALAVAVLMIVSVLVSAILGGFM